MIEDRQHVQSLTRFCTSTVRVLLKGAASMEQIGDTFRLGISAECAQCGIWVSGEELFLLAQPASATDEHPKIKRLRLGDCARSGCNSCYYRLRFWPIGSLEWSKLLSEIEADQKEPPVVSPNNVIHFATNFFCFVPSRKVWVALGLLLLLFTIRQWHQGGRIPFIREPEQFRVDIAPQGDGEQHETFQVDFDDGPTFSTHDAE